METRPFNLKHAKAGAPIGHSRGFPVRILCYDRKSEVGLPIVALVDHGGLWHEGVAEYTWEGHNSYSSLVMLPLGHIDGKPVFVGDVLQRCGESSHAIPGDGRELKEHPERFSWSKKKVIREVWQPQWRAVAKGAPHVTACIYFSREECDRHNKNSMTRGVYLGAVKTGEYEVEE